MTIRKLLIANRGEIAIRIARGAAELGIRTVAVFSEDDANSLHLCKTDEARALAGPGARAYLDVDAIVAAAQETGCDAVHPGYGFLSENAAFARACAVAQLTFVGPRPEVLDLFGDKVRAKALAASCGVPLIEGTKQATSREEAHAFFAALGPNAAMMIKAVAGGGGRGIRAVRSEAELNEAYARSRSEARAAFGNSEVYVERLIERARHIEVQIVGDRHGRISHLWERECTIQRRHQKLIEVAPSPFVSQDLRGHITDAARRMAKASHYDNIGTFEFLIDAAAGDHAFFIEANPRLQVEHTVTEEVFGVDLVKAQLGIAAGATLLELGLSQRDVPAPRGFAMQLRINMETMDENGAAKPSGGTLAAFEPPSGPGIRVDTFGYAGYRTNASFDSLIAKLIAHSLGPRFSDVVTKAYRALCEFRIGGVPTNIAFLQALLCHADLVANDIDTNFVDRHLAELLDAGQNHRQLFVASDESAPGAPPRTGASVVAPPGTVQVVAPLQGTVVAVDVAEGELVRPGQQMAVLEAMKMEHLVTASTGGHVCRVIAKKGMLLMAGDPIAFVEPADVGHDATEEAGEIDLDAIRPDLAEVISRHANVRDENRPEAVGKRRRNNQRTARENVADLCDPGSFIEYGPLAIAAQRRRRSLEDLIKNTPSDGVVAGFGTINADQFGPEGARCLVVAYDYTVLAGTQGHMNHKKQDRMFGLAEQWRIPVVLYAEGGGGRPGDTDRLGLTGLDGPTFAQFARLSGHVPLVGVVSGYCFAGNAALLGCCDVIIATKNASIGMGGPAMIEGGGLGVYRPEEVGPVNFQAPNGVVDVPVEDEIEATAVAKKYLSYFQGAVKDFTCADQRRLRRTIPENRLRVYDIRHVIEILADEGSMLELRRQFGTGMVTALIRIEGHPFGLIANNPKHLGGAIDSEAGDKAAHFVQLCDAFDIPVLSLCDTPGFMVGPEAEKSAIVRHVCRMFVIGASISVPFFTVVVRKGYGLGAQAMAAGGFHQPVFTVAWPTGEFGGMGLEGYVRLGFRKEMEAIADPAERQAYYEKMVAKLYENGKATSIASVLEIDEVIDPAETRRWIMAGLRSVPKPSPRTQRKRPCVDAW
jgi:acetyl/propionyl-CoA carboxylase alpha subunit/acetyl-CoA carboxylase carboxyltransferase component